MKYDPEKHHRRSIRLKNYDYSKAGAYFVTTNAINRERVFGEIADGIMHLNEIGRIVEECWHSIPDHFRNVVLDEFVVMPDHVHGIFFIVDDDSVGATHASPLQNRDTDELRSHASPLQNRDTDESRSHASPLQNGMNDKTRQSLQPHSSSLQKPLSNEPPSYPHGPKSRSVGSIVGSFKSAVTNRVNKINGEIGMTIWQRNYYEHIIRDESELKRRRQYIKDNPANWEPNKEEPRDLI